MSARTNRHANLVDATSAPFSGFTIRSELRQPVNHRLAQIQNCRSALRKRGCGCRRCSTSNCCRRHRFSATSRGLRLESGRNDPDEKANHPPLRLVPGCRRGAKARDCQPQSLWTAILRPTRVESIAPEHGTWCSAAAPWPSPMRSGAPFGLPLVLQSAKYISLRETWL